MNVFIHCAGKDLVKRVKLVKRIDTAIVSLEAHLGIEVDEGLEIVEDAKTVSPVRHIVEISQVDLHGNSINALLKDNNSLLVATSPRYQLHDEHLIILRVFKQDLASVILRAVDSLSIARAECR